MTETPTLEVLNDTLISMVGECSADPYLFVMRMFPWGEPGELEAFDGPDTWQASILADIKKGLLTPQGAIREAVASGHGVGKSALVAWIVLWAISTMVDTKGVVTANTESQLKIKTWSELAKWYRLMLCKEWFEMTATAIYSKDPAHSSTWRVDMVPWSEARSEAFAGLHNMGRRVLVIYDEASAIPDIIWEVTEGALTDDKTEIIWCVFGNPTRSRGRFRECFTRFRERWITRQIDSRAVSRTNKAQLQAWIDDYGDDSDFVKVRVKGEFPSADVNALLSPDDVEAAMSRSYTARDIEGRAKIIGVDVARQGGDDSVIARRQGLVVYPLKVMHIPDTQMVATQIALAHEQWQGSDAVHVDTTGGMGAGVVDAYRCLHRDCTEVYFSGKPSDSRYFNKRSEMWIEMARWIKKGGSLPRDNDLRDELCAASYSYQGDKFRLCDKDEIKEEIGHSPDRADAVALTFAYPVVPNRNPLRDIEKNVNKPRKTLDYNPLEES